jgi:hypothetical protein
MIDAIGGPKGPVGARIIVGQEIDRHVGDSLDIYWPMYNVRRSAETGRNRKPAWLLTRFFNDVKCGQNRSSAIENASQRRPIMPAHLFIDDADHTADEAKRVLCHRGESPLNEGFLFFLRQAAAFRCTWHAGPLG